MRVRDVAFGPGMRTAIIALPQTKTSGPNTEEVVLRDQKIVRALARLCELLEPNDRIYSRPAKFFGEDLRWLGKLVGFSHQRFTPYSLRRGGATYHFHALGSMARTAVAGRWKHEATAKIYIDGAAAEWATWQLTEDGDALLERGCTAFKKEFG